MDRIFEERESLTRIAHLTGISCSPETAAQRVKIARKLRSNDIIVPANYTLRILIQLSMYLKRKQESEAQGKVDEYLDGGDGTFHSSDLLVRKERIESRGYQFFQIEGGDWILCDPMDDDEGFSVLAPNLKECIEEFEIAFPM